MFSRSNPISNALARNLPRIAQILALTLFALFEGEECRAQSTTELHSYHCYLQCPLGQPGTSDLIVRHLYTLSANDEHKMADWIAYKVDYSMFSVRSETNRTWKSDPWLDDDERLEPADYEGAYGSLGTDRGHLAPLASFQSTPHWKETNYLSNVAPQSSQLNRGPWLQIENFERQLARDGHTVYVVTGPFFGNSGSFLPKADESHTVPEGFWKSISAFKEGELRHSIQYYFPNHVNISSEQASTTVQTIEALTGLTLYPVGLPK